MSSSASTIPQPESIEIARKYSAHVIMFHDAMAKYLGLNGSDMQCLNILLCFGAMTPGELAERSGLTTGGITRVLGHLESRDFVRRELSKTDRRSVIIVPMPPKTPHANKQKSIELYAGMSQLASRYTRAEFAVIVDFMQRSIEALHGTTHKLRALDKGYRKEGGQETRKTRA